MSNNDNWGDMLAKPIAVLEEHGLSIREINVLEEQLGFIYVRDLQEITREELLQCPNFGKTFMLNLQTSLLHFLEKEVIDVQEKKKAGITTKVKKRN